MLMVNAYDPAHAQGLDEAAQTLIARRERALGKAYRLFYQTPVHLVRGEGVRLYDPQGRAYLDAYNNVPSVGHAHPRVAEAIARQSAILNTHTRYLHENIVEYAERLLATLPPQLENIMFACTGSEANDLALRIAATVTGGTGVVVTANAYHGVTQALAVLSPSLGAGSPLGPHVRAIDPPEEGSDGEAFALRVRDAFADLARHGYTPSAFLIDTILSSDGVRAEPLGLLKPAEKAAREAGALVIADEVQAGLGRVGTAFWGFARHGLAPDFMTCGKPMGAGHPLACVAARRDLIDYFGSRMRYFNTFGGNPVSAAAGLAVLDILEAERLPENAETTGRFLLDALRAMQAKHARLGAVRGAGLSLAADLPDGEAAFRVVNHMRENGVLISASGPEGASLKIRPPLPFGVDHARELLAALEEALRAL